MRKGKGGRAREQHQQQLSLKISDTMQIMDGRKRENHGHIVVVKSLSVCGHQRISAVTHTHTHTHEKPEQILALGMLFGQF